MKTLLEFVAVQVFVDANFGSQDVVTLLYLRRVLVFFKYTFQEYLIRDLLFALKQNFFVC